MIEYIKAMLAELFGRDPHQVEMVRNDRVVISNYSVPIVDKKNVQVVDVTYDGS